MFKKTLLIAFIITLMTLSGCNSSDSELLDELKDIRGGLEYAILDLKLTISTCESLEKELHIINAADWNAGDLESIREYTTVGEWRADELGAMIEEATDDIEAAMYELQDVIMKYER